MCVEAGITMRILLVEDELSLSRAITAILKKNNYTVDAVYNGREALEYLDAHIVNKENLYDAVIMDIMMPVMDGITALCEIRKKGINTPVLMLSAKAEIDDKIEGLDNGANDYLTKPFDARELLARLRVLTRAREQNNYIITLGNITLNTNTYELSSANGSYVLNNKEYQILAMLIHTPGHIISAEQLMSNIWDSDCDSDINTVWTYISYLRRKLEALNSDYSIATKRNIGYYLKHT